MQARADRRQRAEDDDVAVAPGERPLAVQLQHLRPRDREVRPPRREDEADAREGDDRRVDRPALGAVHDRVDRRDRADDPLAERDDHEQPVPLGDVMCVPRRPALPPLRDDRPDHLDADEHRGDHERRHEREVDDREHDPEDLRDRDRPDVRHGSRSARRVVAGGAQPEEDHRHAHDDVARDHDAVVEDVSLLDRRERLLEPEREHDHAEHLHHRREPHHPVVGVVGRREPRVVDPGPGDRERREAEAEDAGEEVAVREEVRQLVRGDAERDDERQVVEQLERRRAAVLLVRVTTGHPPPAVRAVVGGLRHPGMLPARSDAAR